MPAEPEHEVFVCSDRFPLRQTTIKYSTIGLDSAAQRLDKTVLYEVQATVRQQADGKAGGLTGRNQPNPRVYGLGL